MLQGTKRKTSIYKRIKEKCFLESALIADYQTVEQTFKQKLAQGGKKK